MAATFAIAPRGPFSLAAAASFGFGPSTGVAPTDEPRMRLAFCVDGGRELAGVVLTQDAAGIVHGTVAGGADPAAVQAQVARVLSLDHDGSAFAAAGERDPVLGRLQAEHPGQRPVLFHSPYEAAAWGVIAQRRPVTQAAVVRRAIAERHGAVFELDGEPVAAFPTPEALTAVEAMPGLPEVKVQRLHGIAAAALAGRLDADALRALDPDAALGALRELPGIGPFYASLILVRATGHADLLPAGEPRTRRAAAHFYDLPAPPSPEEFLALAEPWRPYRTWGAVLLQLSARRAGVV